MEGSSFSQGASRPAAGGEGAGAATGGGLRRAPPESMLPPKAPLASDIDGVMRAVGEKHKLQRAWTYWEDRAQNSKQVRTHRPELGEERAPETR